MKEIDIRCRIRGWKVWLGMIECKAVRKSLFNIYNETILCRIGTGEKIVYNATGENYFGADMAVYIHEKLRKAAVWNLEARRKSNHIVKNLSFGNLWSNIVLEPGKIIGEYKKMGNGSDAPYEKVLFLDIDTLFSIRDELYEYLQINSDDIGFPKDIDNSVYEMLPDNMRKRYSTSYWERNRRFRNAVLHAYDFQCAICRCHEEKLLEAAHIKAVADDGTDELNNGICLCANHHIMFDKGLLKIDFKERRLSYLDDGLKDMPWYNVFIEKYNGQIIYVGKNVSQQ